MSLSPAIKGLPQPGTPLKTHVGKDGGAFPHLRDKADTQAASHDREKAKGENLKN
ncbi:hypothetical protein HK405_001786, partial [Cladochytrium tenue]